MTDRPILFSAPMVRALIREAEHPGTGKTTTRRILKLPAKHCINPKLGGWEPTINGGGGCFTIGRNGERLTVPESVGIWNQTTGYCMNAPYQVGDRLWVREAWRTPSIYTSSPSDLIAKCLDAGYKKPWCPIQFDADKARVNWDDPLLGEPGRLRVATHLPRAFSRLTLIVTGVKVERLQDISEEDARAEGVAPHLDGFFPYGITTCFTTVVNDREVPAQYCPTARQSFRMLWEHINGREAWDANPWIVAPVFKVIKANIDSAEARIA